MDKCLSMGDVGSKINTIYCTLAIINKPMDFFVIGITAFLASILTFFSGFGLGTILTPVFAIFFPAEIAVAQTSIVHFINNIFKLGLTRKHIKKTILFKFGISAVMGAFIGAYLLVYFSAANPMYVYYLNEREFLITPLKLVIGTLIIIFSVIEFLPRFSKQGFAVNNLFAGGLLSGFFGGLSGHQGALRSAFLIQYKLSKEEFIATGTAIACIIDVTRISMYLTLFFKLDIFSNVNYIAFASVCAITGAFIGNKLLKKTTIKLVQVLTHVLLITLAIVLGAGLI